MRKKITHKMRVEKVKEFTEKNKLFTIIALITVIYLAFNIISGMISKKDNEITDTATSQSEEISEKAETEAVEEYDDEHLHFYWIDLWIFLIAGGFCTVMIIREKKKAREKL